MPIIALTEANLRQLPALAAAAGLTLPALYWDPVAKGLGVRLNRGGSIAWVMKMRIGGKPHWETLGEWPQVKPKPARAAHDAMKTRLRQGTDPRQDRYTPIFWPDLVDKFEADHLPNLKEKTQENYRSILRLHIRPAFPGKLAQEIVDADVRTFHKALGKTGKTRQANVCLGLLRMIFNRAEAWKHRPLNSNPVDLLRKGNYRPFPEASRQRPLEDDELIRLGLALGEMDAQGYGQFCNFVRVLYFSGARRGEVLGLSWDWINVDRKMISWPDSKTGQTSKPLNDALFEVLANIPRFQDVPWVFPSGESASGHLEDIKRPWKLMLKLAGIEDLTRHDLRHNVGNQAAELGENLQTVAALLGHKQTATTERYSKAKGLDASNRTGVVLKWKLGVGRA